jgi:hypothetical protein
MHLSDKMHLKKGIQEKIISLLHSECTQRAPSVQGENLYLGISFLGAFCQ